MTELIAIDPGDAHVGVAFFDRIEDDNGQLRPAERDDSWECVDVQEFSPDDFATALAETLMANDVSIIVYERFLLYADKSAEQVGSEFETAQLIGVIKWLVRIHNEHAYAHALADSEGTPPLLPCEAPGRFCNDPGRYPRPVQIFGHLADIKKPTAGILRKKGIKSTARRLKAGVHCADAELHGWRYLLRTRHG